MSKTMLISPKYKLTAKFADGSEVFGRARQIIPGEIGNLREQVRILREAGQGVINAWESGDLAGAVRKLSAALEATKKA